MGVIQKQSIQSTVVIMLGFAIGAFNMILIVPKVLPAEVFGLTRIITDAGLTLATMCTLGTLPVIYKFFPFYKSYLKPEKNDLPSMTLLVCLIGFPLMCLGGYAAKDIIVRKFSDKSPLFVEYSYLVYPFAFFMMLFIWLESFAWSFKKTVISNSLKETLARVLFTILLVLSMYGYINHHQFVTVFSLSYLLPAVLLFIVLIRTNQFRFTFRSSHVTNRLKYKMANFGLFIFGAQFLNLLSRTIDTFILSAKSERGLADAAVFTIATYVVTLMEIPQRSITAISTPVLAESWKNKDMVNIAGIYKKSVSNLLIVGVVMFGIIWLNINNLAEYLGKDYAGIEMLVLLMGIGKLIDLGTGTNGQIIGTSSFWKVDFTTNVIYTILALPLNYILISKYGLMGAAYSTVIALSFYNAMRFLFLWYKFGLQPYTNKNLLTIIIAFVVTFLIYLIPDLGPVFLDAFVRTFLFLLLFIPAIYLSGASIEINEILKKQLQNIIGKRKY